MAFVTEEKLEEVARVLREEVYEAEFRGKDRGRFAITRAQLKQALGVEKLHAATLEKLQDRALEKGLVVIDLDDIFPCIETRVARTYRKPPRQAFDQFFPPEEEEQMSAEDDD
ncbi:MULTISPECIES: hypothetical protein [unclassified Mesorhizobium]|uniref:hypothetical protein n=1 Tax=unclassified Mesorhizobium TaxID=325217 RepID=UPI000FD29B77|nr:hypothetical protein [Mesorhizobium sp. M6A.T.Cr.TU.017.01.1.1]RUV00687.1 hypothetical protein EOB36_15950 [Mesorhizobium sp. M6A.T.Cr.TU.017.01.1.1]